MHSIWLWDPYLLAGVGVIAFILWFFEFPDKDVRKLPGPWHTKYTHIGLKMATLGARRVFYVHNLHLKYGPIVRISPAEVDISDVESFRNIHRPGSGYTKTPFYATLPVNIRLGIFAMSDLKAHAVRRKLFARPFSKTFLRSNWEPVVLDRIKLSMKRIKEDADASADGEVDVMKWWLFLAGDVSTHLMFGESFHTLETGEPGIYNRVPELAIKGAAIDTQFPLLGFFAKRLPIKSFQDMYTAPATLLKFAGIALAQNKEKGTSTNIFAAVAKEVAKGEGGLLGDIDVQVEASNLIIAGSDTTGISMTFMIYNILLRPELQAALEEEVKDVSDSPLDEEMEGLPLLNAIFWESMRVHGAIPSGLPRVVPAQGANFLGYHVPAGFTVTTQAYSLHREPSVFPDPEKFDASRWLPENADKLSPLAKIAWCPFGAGARLCLGLHLAEMEIRIATALFFKHFRGVKMAPSMKPSDMELENFFLIAPVSHKLKVVLPKTATIPPYDA